MKIAVVILNWNGKLLLETFLPSVINCSNDAEIILADNNSTDDSIAYTKTHFPTVKIIKNNTNGGYAKGYNDALKHLKADVFCLLNNDVQVTKGWVSPIIQQFINEPNTAIIQPKLLDYANPLNFEYAGAAGGFIDKYAYPFCRGRIFNTIEKDSGQYSDDATIFWASGACLFIRKSVFDALNGFDERFFAHMEEIDLCWRAKLLGYTVKYNGRSTVYHKGGGTLSAINPRKTYFNFRNSLFTLVKNSSLPLFPLIPTRLLLDGLAAIKFLASLKFNHAFAILKAHLSFYKHLADLISDRRLLKNSQKYAALTSIVWAYYVSNKKRYKDL